MTFQSNGTRWKKIFRNASILGGIAAVSNTIASGDISLRVIYTGILTGILVALVEIKHAYKILPTPKLNHKAQSSFFLS